MLITARNLLYKYMKGKTPDIIKAARKGLREAEFEMLGPGFHSRHHVVESKKVYNRKKNKRYPIYD